jgi:hypothetical protein
MFPLFSNIFLGTNSSDSVDVNDELLDTSNNVGYTYCCVDGCNCLVGTWINRPNKSYSSFWSLPREDRLPATS